jgi:hypothetical protein
MKQNPAYRFVVFLLNHDDPAWKIQVDPADSFAQLIYEQRTGKQLFTCNRDLEFTEFTSNNL